MNGTEISLEKLRQRDTRRVAAFGAGGNINGGLCHLSDHRYIYNKYISMERNLGGKEIYRD